MAEDPFQGLLSVVCGQLDRLQLSDALIGSVASSVFGEPRASLAIDVGLRMTQANATALAAALPKRFYRSPEALAQPAQASSVANLVDLETGIKVDLSVLSAKPFYDSALARRRLIEYRAGGPAFWTASAEDVVLMKLIWRKDSRSRRQRDDAVSVASVQGARLDWSYMRDWAKRLGLATDLQAIFEAAGI